MATSFRLHRCGLPNHSNISHNNNNNNCRRKLYHSLDHSYFLQQLNAQPQHPTQYGVEPMHRFGWLGVVYQATLAPYGYTFIGKGTVRQLRDVLLREADKYGVMRHLQDRAMSMLRRPLRTSMP